MCTVYTCLPSLILSHLPNNYKDAECGHTSAEAPHGPDPAGTEAEKVRLAPLLLEPSGLCPVCQSHHSIHPPSPKP